MEAGEESKEEEKDQSQDVSAIYSSEDDSSGKIDHIKGPSYKSQNYGRAGDSDLQKIRIGDHIGSGGGPGSKHDSLHEAKKIGKSKFHSITKSAKMRVSKREEEDDFEII